MVSPHSLQTLQFARENSTKRQVQPEAHRSHQLFALTLEKAPPRPLAPEHPAEETASDAAYYCHPKSQHRKAYG
jgi:hypothetical protein